MLNLRNKVQLIGNLGADPEIKEFPSGKMKSTFKLATHENIKNSKGEWEKVTQWHNVTGWGKLAENISKNLKKGSEVLVSGKLTSRQYEDEKGNKKYYTEIVADGIENFSRKEVVQTTES